MKTTPRIGNDVVDLDLPLNKGKHADARFIARVFTSAEQDAIHASKNPDLTLWSIWAAKETAYKIVKKIDPAFIFSPQRIGPDTTPIRGLPDGSPHNAADSTVLVDGCTYAIRWMWTEHYINCIGINENPDSTVDDIRASVASVNDELFASLSPSALSERERSSCYSKESTLVRFLAKHLLEERGLPHIEVIRERLENSFAPPSLVSDKGGAKDMDISLSHDGQWLSVALLV